MILLYGVSGLGKMILFNIMLGLLKLILGMVFVEGSDIYFLLMFECDDICFNCIGMIF